MRSNNDSFNKSEASGLFYLLSNFLPKLYVSNKSQYHIKLPYFLKFISLGFDGTSDVLAAKKFKIPVKGTHAHAFVSSFNKNDEVNKFRKLLNKNKGKPEPLLPVVEVHLKKICDFLGISKVLRVSCLWILISSRLSSVLFQAQF